MTGPCMTGRGVPKAGSLLPSKAGGSFCQTLEENNFLASGSDRFRQNTRGYREQRDARASNGFRPHKSRQALTSNGSPLHRAFYCIMSYHYVTTPMAGSSLAFWLPLIFLLLSRGLFGTKPLLHDLSTSWLLIPSIIFFHRWYGARKNRPPGLGNFLGTQAAIVL